jgi:polyisoprenyl-phosphate glycosyltransferase
MIGDVKGSRRDRCEDGAPALAPGKLARAMVRAIAVDSGQSAEPELSVVVPAFEEAASLAELYRELSATLARLDLTWEIVVADDGSGDATWQEVLRLHRIDPRVRGVRLSRNFGHQFALFAGLTHARGKAVISMDADLQHPPAMIRALVRLWRRGYKVVQTVRRDDATVPVHKRWTSRLFYRLYSFLSGTEMRPGVADFRLLDRDVVDVLLALPEAGLFLRGLVGWVGFPTAYVPYRVRPRFAGRSKYRWAKMLSLAWQGIASFSIVPLRLGIILGLLTGGLAIVELGYVVAVAAFSDQAVPGWASAVGLTSLLFAMLFLMLGVIGEYIGRILIEVRGRPRFVVAEGVGLTLETRLDPARWGGRRQPSGSSAGPPLSVPVAPVAAGALETAASRP